MNKRPEHVGGPEKCVCKTYPAMQVSQLLDKFPRIS